MEVLEVVLCLCKFVWIFFLGGWEGLGGGCWYHSVFILGFLDSVSNQIATDLILVVKLKVWTKPEQSAFCTR